MLAGLGQAVVLRNMRRDVHAPSGGRRTLARAGHLAIAQAGSMAGPPANRVRQSYGSAPATPRERVYVSRAADDPPESAPPAGCTRKSRPDPGIDRVSSARTTRIKAQAT